MYALATIPFIRRLPDSVLQVWYSEDAAAASKYLVDLGPNYGYFARHERFLIPHQVPPPSCSACMHDIRYGMMTYEKISLATALCTCIAASKES